MLLKEVYNQKFLNSLAEAISESDDSFDVNSFLKISQTKQWSDLALKQRMRKISISIHEFLPLTSYQEKIEVLKKAVMKIPKDKNSGLSLIIFPDFIEVFGCEEYVRDISSFDSSMKALEFFTEYGSSEFAVRQFIKIDQKAALEFFNQWSKSQNYHIRRLASEGIRPRLPWGEALQEFKKDPSEILPILEELKNDESEYVRRSVANNLNDISKDNPQIVLNLLDKWLVDVCPKQIKHALRTLLKLGDKKALGMVGIKTDLETTQNFSIKNFYLKNNKIKIGETIEFDFTLHNQSSEQKSGQNIRLEYIIYFLRKNGGQSKKVFQITSKKISKGVFDYSKKHSFKNMTTRKHYCGQQAISLVVNGLELEKKKFELF